MAVKQVGLSNIQSKEEEEEDSTSSVEEEEEEHSGYAVLLSYLKKIFSTPLSKKVNSVGNPFY